MTAQAGDSRPMADSNDPIPMPVGASARRRTRQVRVRWDDNEVVIGSDGPVVVQSMTNTDTAEAIATAIQTRALAKAGSELVRITVNTPAAAGEVGAIREQLDRMGCKVPLVGDFHYNGHKLLHDFPNARLPCPSTGSTPATSVPVRGATTTTAP